MYIHAYTITNIMNKVILALMCNAMVTCICTNRIYPCTFFYSKKILHSLQMNTFSDQLGPPSCALSLLEICSLCLTVFSKLTLGYICILCVYYLHQYTVYICLSMHLKTKLIPYQRIALFAKNDIMK